jgi:hypothetical protein
MLKRLLPLALLPALALVSSFAFRGNSLPAELTAVPIRHPRTKQMSRSDLFPVGSRGQLAQAVTPGRVMPGGGRFQGLAGRYATALNAARQHVFVAVIAEGGTTRRAAYRLDADGTLSLILKEGMQTGQGTVQQLVTSRSTGIGLTDQGQVALPALIDGGRAVVLLTSATS